MSDSWYYRHGNESHGPITGRQLRELVTSKQLGPGDLVRRDGMPQWIPVSQLQGTVRTAASQSKGSGEQTGARGSSPSAVLPTVPIKPTSKSGPSTAPVAKAAMPQKHAPGTVLPAVPLPVAAQASSKTAVPIARPVLPQQNPREPVLPAVPLPAAATAPVAKAQPADSGESFDIDSLAVQSTAKSARHTATKKEKTNPFIWVAVGVPAAFIGFWVLGAIVGGSSKNGDVGNTSTTLSKNGDGGNTSNTDPKTTSLADKKLSMADGDVDANALCERLAYHGQWVQWSTPDGGVDPKGTPWDAVSGTGVRVSLGTSTPYTPSGWPPISIAVCVFRHENDGKVSLVQVSSPFDSDPNTLRRITAGMRSIIGVCLNLPDRDLNEYLKEERYHRGNSQRRSDKAVWKSDLFCSCAEQNRDLLCHAKRPGQCNSPSVCQLRRR